MSHKRKKNLSKLLSYALRHQPDALGLQLDSAGWATVDALLQGIQKKGYDFGFDELLALVKDNDKQRFSFNEDQTKIRANQGHSIKLDLQLKAIEPPEYLYHGTATRFLKSINQQGLQKRNRHHVHLSANKVTAKEVGSRHGVPVVLVIAAGQMYREGYAFYCSDNQVWLTEQVPSSHIQY